LSGIRGIVGEEDVHHWSISKRGKLKGKFWIRSCSLSEQPYINNNICPVRAGQKGDQVMKKSLLVAIAIGFALSYSSVAMAGIANGSGIDGTHHDLSTHGAAGGAFGDTADAAGLNRICVYCHAPHNTNPASAGLNGYRPLWNHDATAVSSFTMYDPGPDQPNSIAHRSQAFDFGAIAPGSVSMLCLSCHDGVTATNAYGFASNPSPGRGNADKFVSARAVIGGAAGDLQNHHPIGFDYDIAQASDPELRLSSAAGYLTDATVGTVNNGPQTIAELLWKGNVECVSCHDVHNTQNGGDKFTWVQDKNSALCLTCHAKGVPNTL
jgi:predicted CXXCH cytochrome family protein